MEEKWIFLAGLVLLSALANQGMMMTMMLTGNWWIAMLTKIMIIKMIREAFFYQEDNFFTHF